MIPRGWSRELPARRRTAIVAKVAEPTSPSIVHLYDELYFVRCTRSRRDCRTRRAPWRSLPPVSHSPSPFGLIVEIGYLVTLINIGSRNDAKITISSLAIQQLCHKVARRPVGLAGSGDAICAEATDGKIEHPPADPK